MKKSELKKLIKEEIKKVLGGEEWAGSTLQIVSVNESMAEPLFPDVLKIKKSTVITPNANNPSDTLPAGIYKSTDEEFDTMHIYISKGKKWFLYPEDIDMINEK